MQKKTNSPYFAEAIHSSLIQYKAQSWAWNIFPSFGTLVVTENKQQKIFGIVHAITTGSNDPIRQPFAFQKTEEELLAEQPQIFEFLSTHFEVIITGFIKDDRLVYHLPPHPPQMHSFVRNATPQEYAMFASSTHFLHMIFNASDTICNTDELILALLNHSIEQKFFSSHLLEEYIETITQLTKHDYQRLKTLLQRIQHIFAIHNITL